MKQVYYACTAKTEPRAWMVVVCLLLGVVMSIGCSESPAPAPVPVAIPNSSPPIEGAPDLAALESLPINDFGGWVLNGDEAPKQVASPPENRSRFKSDSGQADLQRIANDATAKRQSRTEAIFSLFATHLKLGDDAAAVAKTLQGGKWLNEADLYGVYAIAGLVPVEWTGKDTIFCIHLLPDKKGWSDWVIYFRLSGGSGRSADEARSFLQGVSDLKGSPKLVEFALCLASVGEQQPGRIERFCEDGLWILPSLRPRR